MLSLISIRGLISWHIVIGALLIPPALAKTATTGCRAPRYYRGDEGYKTSGPPPLLLRLLGPLVVLTSVTLLATGTTPVLIGEEASRQTLTTAAGFSLSWPTVHQASFIA